MSLRYIYVLLIARFFTPLKKMLEVHKVAIKTLTDANFGYKKIAKQLGLNQNTVKSHIRKTKSIQGLPPKIKLFKGKITERKQLQVKKYIIEHPFATNEEIILALALPVSPTTMGRYLRRFGMPRSLTKRRILLFEPNRVKRLAFAKKLITWSDEKLNRIFWTDETKVQAWPNGEHVFYRAPEGTEIITPMKQNGGSGVMFWGCMSHQAWGCLTVVKGTIDGSKYLQLLKDHVVPEFDASPVPLIFQQDNAPCHKKREVLDFLASTGWEILEWPPQSPDLSPIEWVWNQIKMKMKAINPSPRTPATIQEAILEIWDELTAHARVKTVETFRERLKECIKNKGGFTRF